MPDNKQLNNPLKMKNQSAQIKKRTLECPNFILT